MWRLAASYWPVYTNDIVKTSGVKLKNSVSARFRIFRGREPTLILFEKKDPTGFALTLNMEQSKAQ